MKHPLGAAGLSAAAAAAVGLFLLIGSGPAIADGAGAGILGSPHDFTDNLSPEEGAVAETPEWNFRGEICRVCHVPHDHGRDTAIFDGGGLLWNHELSAATYTMYDDTWSPTLDNAQDAQPTGIAKLCLGCHDGTIALDAFDSRTGAGTSVTMADEPYDHFQVPRNLDGTNLDLRGTHPISIVYDETVDTGLYPKTDPMGSSGSIADVLEGGTKLQCSSCHDVHDEEAVAETHLLRVSNSTPPSGLCLTCHNKDQAN